MQNLNYKQAFNKLNVALFISNLYGGLKWTGLPTLAVAVTGDSSLFSMLFIITSVLGLYGSLQGGSIADKFGVYISLLFSFIFSITAYLLAFIVFTQSNAIVVIIVLAIALSLVDNLVGPAFATWIQFILKNINEPYEKALSTRQILSISAKLIAFPLGPVLYTFFKEYMFLITVFFVAVEIIIILSLKSYIIALSALPKVKQKWFNKAFWGSINKPLKQLLIINFSLGFMAFGLTSCLLVLVSKANANYISLYWLFGGVAGLLANVYIKFFVDKFNKLKQINYSLFIRACIMFLIILLSSNVYAILLLDILYLLLAPIFTIINTANFYSIVNSTAIAKGKINALSSTVFGLGNIMGLLILQIFIIFDYTKYYLAIIMVVLILQIYLKKQFYKLKQAC